MNATATFKTDRADRYLTALCHHFGRKVDAECDAAMGWIQFPFGRCALTADTGILALRVSAPDAPRLDQVMRIVTSHLERFAFREDPKLDWQIDQKTH